MKKLFIAICCMLGLTFAFCASVGVTNEEMVCTYASVESTDMVVVEENIEEEFDWAVWFNEEALPVLIAVGAAIITLCGTLYPILKTVTSGVKLFKTSKQNFDTATNGVVASQKQISEMKNNTEEQIESLKEQLNNMGVEIKQIKSMLKIAFCNNEELVKNGYANEIMKVGEENGSQEIKETNNTDANA